MHSEDLLPSLLVWAVDEDLPIEAPGAQQRRVQNLRAVRRAEQHEAARRIEPVEFGQKLVEGLILLVMPAADIGTAGAAKGIELVDEDDRRRMLARLIEQVADARRADTDKHLDKLRAGDREERDPGLTGHSAGEQRLAGARRADQQHPLRRAAPEASVADRVFQEIDDLDELVLGFVDTRDIGEGDLGLLLDIDLGAAFADRHQPAEAALTHAADREHPDPDKENRRQDPG